MFAAFQHGLISQWQSLQVGDALNSLTQLTYPVARVSGYKIPLQRLFYGVVPKDYNTTDTRYTEPAARLSNMEEARPRRVAGASDVVDAFDCLQIIMLIFHAEVTNELADRRLTEWEMRVSRTRLRS